MKKIVSGIFIIMMCVFLSGCSLKFSVKKPSNNTSTGVNPDQSVKSKASDLEKNITTTTGVTAEKKLVVIAKNSNKEAVSLKITAEFYDENGKIVGSEYENLNCLGANSEGAVEMFDTPSSYAKFKIYADVEDNIYKSYIDQVSITHNKSGDQVVAQVTNNSSETLSYVDAAVVYYQGNQIVGFDDNIETDVKPGRAANFNFYGPVDSNYDDVPFDTYKVFVNGAYLYLN
ncbi:MAG: hypothetical protein J5970_02650 [Bacilli bacterium]|nr:hypothetical protein [Bacilli bacterium]